MTPLRRRMTEDMKVRNFSSNTQMSYLQQVTSFANYFHCSPELLGPAEIRAYQVHITTERKLAPGSLAIIAAALRFLYKVTLKREWVEQEIPFPKTPYKLPVILSREEVGHFLECIASRKHRTILIAAYAAGLRVTEATRLKVADIDSQRMTLRVVQGKGSKDRLVMLSPQLLDVLRSYWKISRPKDTDWLFPGDIPGRPITRFAVEAACQKAHRLSGIKKPITPHSLRHALPRTCWNPAPTCAQSNCCSVIAVFRRPRATCWSPPARCARPPVPLTCCHGRRPQNRHPFRQHISELLRWAPRGSKWRTCSAASVRRIDKHTRSHSHAVSSAR